MHAQLIEFVNGNLKMLSIGEWISIKENIIKALIAVFLSTIIIYILGASIIKAKGGLEHFLIFILSLSTIGLVMPFVIYSDEYKNDVVNTGDGVISSIKGKINTIKSSPTCFNNIIDDDPWIVSKNDKKSIEIMKNERDVLFYDEKGNVLNADAFPTSLTAKQKNDAKLDHKKKIESLTLYGNKNDALASIIKNKKELKKIDKILALTERKDGKTTIYYREK